ncbi:FKBP-type peptidyl-prolyl cis-trans isomerase [Pontibacter sp. JAM-7]|uniref:FKBP-type peptidyl-prolyl cis-trans isomerase n=1 Tax=Pontibacter sp. JAM-7 TaxID=3366581 RepID=UPI003AF93F53
MSKLIGPGKTVTLFFSIKLEGGELVDSNFGATPATFTIGDGNMLEGFEKALFGLEEGTEHSLKILPENGFGMPNPSNIHRIPRSQFADMEIEEGLVVSFSDPASGELPGIITSIGEDKVAVDFNHPLAGKSLQFDVEIISVADASSSSSPAE